LAALPHACSAASITPAWLPLVMPEGATENVILEALPDFGQLVIAPFASTPSRGALRTRRFYSRAGPRRWNNPGASRGCVFLLYTLCFLFGQSGRGSA